MPARNVVQLQPVRVRRPPSSITRHEWCAGRPRGCARPGGPVGQSSALCDASAAGVRLAKLAGDARGVECRVREQWRERLCCRLAAQEHVICGMHRVWVPRQTACATF